MSQFFSCKADITVSISFQLMGRLNEIMYVNQVPQWPPCFLHDKQWIADGFPGLQTPIHMHSYISECLSFSSIPSGFLVPSEHSPPILSPPFPVYPLLFLPSPFSTQDTICRSKRYYCCSVAKLYPTLCDPINCSTPGFPVLHYLPEFAQAHVQWVSDAIQPSHPLLPPPSLALSRSQHQGLFQELAPHIKWPKYWSFNFSISPANEYSGLISFRIDWFDLFACQGTLKSLLQHNSKAPILQRSTFFMVQLSHPYMITSQTVTWLYGPLSAKWCLSFLICCLDLS